MLFCINTIHSGFMGGVLAFLLFWYASLPRKSNQGPANVSGSLPGAVGMYGLSVGISRVGNTLPKPVYSLLSGLNAATVGIIALAAVRLSELAITDKLTRFLVYLGGLMGMLYTALWYYPVLMLGAGLSTLVWDLGYMHRIADLFGRLRQKLMAKPKKSVDLEKISWGTDSQCSTDLWKPLPPAPPPPAWSPQRPNTPESAYRNPRPPPQPAPPANKNITLRAFSSMSWQLGLGIIIFFLITFILTLVLHSLASKPTRSFSLFSSLYLAGTIIFGGGPVVIPLLREYIVTPGWVSARDFLLGLAVIQAFPGPNFNFAVYLGSLAVAGTTVPSYLGALIAFVAMYAPGLFIVVGFMGLWRLLREQAWFLAILRGVNAAAVGLVFTAVYKLWQIGYLTDAVQGGSPLGTDPWLVAITGTAFVGGAWFKLSPPVAILLGGAMGMARYGIVKLE